MTKEEALQTTTCIYGEASNTHIHYLGLRQAQDIMTVDRAGIRYWKFGITSAQSDQWCEMQASHLISKP
ncbi:hypothetical protein RRG08_056018 [Elysia crispata]|uniref:Uncharacterized protein n=1 Tax=Elysia crispata TaxID=231223 RepID=A0AAE1AGN4_9GAST|nr:hypothetical protein RRG08_056018 [Elysia crispata]